VASKRQLGAWGFEGGAYPAPAPLLVLLSERLGEAAGLPRADLSRFEARPRRLPELPAERSDELFDRLLHSRGQGLTDLIRLRAGAVPAVADTVLRPVNEAEVEAVLQAAASSGVRVIPFGGGTSVTGGVNVLPGDEPVVSLDLERLSGISDLDERSGLATFGAGTAGPALEEALAARGFTLGHFPQSFECSTLGGWIATRASGQESLGYGGIEGLVAGLELVAPAGKLSLPAFPASASGPDLRQLVLGSEGRFGVITRATVRVRSHPSSLQIKGTLLPSWEDGIEAARRLLQERVPLDVLRLSDPTETEFALAVGLRKDRPTGRIARRLLGLRGVTERSCMMLSGAVGDSIDVDGVLREAAAILKSHGGVGLGASPGKRWVADRFRHPYLRDSLLDHGYATDTLETAAPWSRLGELSSRIASALSSALARDDERVVVLCHLSHAYPDGASLYFTYFFRTPNDPDEATARWAGLKRAATTAILDSGGTLSHHHGIGSWHAPWYEREVGASGWRLVERIAAELDPTGTLNPHVLLDPVDRLES
jgi:alkyldihydroxyacetonephosphate synthase